MSHFLAKMRHLIYTKNMPRPYKPTKLPAEIDKSSFTNELAEACFELGELNGLHRNIPEPALLIAPLTTKEATISSKIEGTRSTVRDVMLFEAGAAPKYDDTLEVVNYKRAMYWAMNALKERSFNLSFIKELHSLLLKDTRGHDKRGEFRKEQVFIGKEGDTIETATYVPPEPILVPEYMENLESYISKNGENPLVKAAVIHYQFEAIHPFSDGNGRIGRIIIPLYLHQKKMLFQPILYLSGYFEKHRNLYIGALHQVDETKKLEEWIRFFLTAIKEQARETQTLIKKINDLKDEVMKKSELMRSPYAHKAVDFFFQRPIFRSPQLIKKIGAKSRMTSLRLLDVFKKSGIVVELTGKDVKRNFPGRGRLFVFSKLLDLL